MTSNTPRGVYVQLTIEEEEAIKHVHVYKPRGGGNKACTCI